MGNCLMYYYISICDELPLKKKEKRTGRLAEPCYLLMQTLIGSLSTAEVTIK